MHWKESVLILLHDYWKDILWVEERRIDGNIVPKYVFWKANYMRSIFCMNETEIPNLNKPIPIYVFLASFVENRDVSAYHSC